VRGKLYILGICGTFMGGLALLARQRGYVVAGCDAGVYPPMSTQLEAAGIDLDEGWDPQRLPADALIVVGNALSRGNPCVEAMLERDLRYVSGPQWLAEEVLRGQWVVAAAGTHGKTTVSSLIAWLLEAAGREPGFLIGGVPKNFGQSARAGAGECFVVEADEYDTAFFDKRAKFVHYRPRTLVINNLEYDHADIYADLAAIQRQFHHLVRCVPASGLLVTPDQVPAIEQTLALGCWTPRQTVSVHADPQQAEASTSAWCALLEQADGSAWRLRDPDGRWHAVRWSQRGAHNVANAAAAVAAAAHLGVPAAASSTALADFGGVRRRLELLGSPRGVEVYDDFAHHPTAIRSTLEGLRASGGGRILAVIEPRSNTMRMGEHRRDLAPSTAAADRVYWFEPPALGWSLGDVVAASPVPAQAVGNIEQLVAVVAAEAREGDRVVVMSNGGFAGVHGRLLAALGGELAP
jgi:UDP-N-acetylmuramate: L-alanyl-gamma-D-glutamyl-meso-diaminopimelate ligase